jgi:hypothetical protein
LETASNSIGPNASPKPFQFCEWGNKDGSSVTRGNSIIDGFDIIDLLRCPNCDALFEAASSFEFVRPAKARRSAA